jgi:hypothetical protein
MYKASEYETVKNPVVKLFLKFVNNWGDNKKNKSRDKTLPPKTIQLVCANNIAFDNFTRDYGDELKIEHNNVLNTYKIKNKFVGRQCFFVWGELA